MKQLILLIATTSFLAATALAQAPFNLHDNTGAGNCLEFDGNDHVSIPNDPILNFGTTDFSFELWMKIDPNATFSTTYQLLCKKTNGVELYEVQVDIFRNIICHFGFSPTSILSTTLVEKDVWYHLAIVRESGIGKLYVNGVQEGSVASTQNITGASNVFLGMDATGVEFLHGIIDEVRIWNIARTQTQIRDNMCRQLTGTETGLVGYWPMNEGADNTCAGGEDVCDQSGNNNHGTKF
ncbi:LamG domain-containing protein [Flavobacteriales bacterium]|nr:LamG domain-containing protein [Flavobacteriales bacterium]